VAKSDHITLELDGHDVRFSNPGKVFFPARGHTKLDLGRYYLDVADAVLRDRPTPSKRAAIDDHPGSLDSLLELAERDERGRLGDAP
jgi:hypothetical protein